MAITETASISLSVNGAAAEKELERVNSKIRELKQLRHDIAKTDDVPAFKKLTKEIGGLERESKKLQRELFDTQAVLKRLDRATPDELKKTLKELTKAMNSGEVRRGSKEWDEYAQSVRRVRKEITKVNSEQSATQSSGEKAGGFIRRNITAIGGMIATVTGLAMALSSLRDARDGLEESKANLKALTGLDNSSIAWLTEQANVVSTTEQNGVRIRKSSQEILDAYMLVGSAKPELLGSKEALHQVTMEAMILAEASKMDLATAVDSVTLSMNQYSAGAEEAARYTNVLAAGSKYGAANVESLAATVRKAGVSASSAGIPFEQLVGATEMLAEKGIKAEVAGTGLKSFFLKMQQGADDVNPKVVGLQKALENLAKENLSVTEITKRYGEEAYSVAQTLINNAAGVQSYTDAVTGTSIALEQAQINSDTAAAKRAQASNQLKMLGIELMEKLSPSINVATNAVVGMTKVLMALISWISKNIGTVIALSVAVSAYIVVLNAKAVAEAKNVAMKKASIVLNGAYAVATKALAIAKLLLTGNIKGATIAWKALNSTMKANVFVLIASLVIGATVAIYKWATATSAATKAAKECNNEILKEKMLAGQLFDALKKAKEGTELRRDLITEINKKYGEYLPNLLTEKSSYDEIEQALNRVNIALETNIAKKLKGDAIATAVSTGIKDQQESLENIRAFLSKRIGLPSPVVNDAIKSLKKMVDDSVSKGDDPDEIFSKLFAKTASYFPKNNNVVFGQARRDDLHNLIRQTRFMQRSIKEINEKFAPFFPEKTIPTPSLVAPPLAENTAFPTLSNSSLGISVLGSMAPAVSKENPLAGEAVIPAPDAKTVTPTPPPPLSAEEAKKRQEEITKSLDAEKKKQYNILLASHRSGEMLEAEFNERKTALDLDFLNKKLARFKAAGLDTIDLTTEIMEKELSTGKSAADKELKALDSDAAREKQRLELRWVLKEISEEEYRATSLKNEETYLTKKKELLERLGQDTLEVELRLAKAKADAQAAEYKKKFRALESSSADERKSIEEQYANGKISKELYDTLIFNLELKLLKERRDLMKKFGLDISGIEGQIADKVVGEAKRRNKAEKDEVKDKKAAAADELAAWELAFQKKEITEEQYAEKKKDIAKQAAKDEEDEEAKKKSDREKAAVGVINMASDIAAMGIQIMDISRQREERMVNDKYAGRLKAAEGDAEATKAIEAEKEAELLAIKKEYADKGFALQVMSIIAATALAAMSAYASAAAIPLVGQVLGPIAAGLAVAAGVVQIASANEQRMQAQQLYTGGWVSGYTGDGIWDEPRGVVHAGEWVANRHAVGNPAARRAFDIIEYAQRNNYLSTLTPDALASSIVGEKTGAYRSPVQAHAAPEAPMRKRVKPGADNGDRLTKVLARLEGQLDSGIHSYSTITGPRGSERAKSRYNFMKRKSNNNTL